MKSNREETKRLDDEMEHRGNEWDTYTVTLAESKHQANTPQDGNITVSDVDVCRRVYGVLRVRLFRV